MTAHVNATKTSSKTIGITICLIALVAITTQTSQADPIKPGDADYEWLFDEGVGITVADSGAAGAGKNANFIGSPAWSTETPFSYPGNNSLQTNSEAIAGGAATVDGFNVDMGTQSTVSMWVRYVNQVQGFGAHYLHDTGAGTGRFLWYYFPTGAPRADAIYWNSTNLGNAGLSTLVDGQWVHRAVVRDGSELRVFEDGVLVRTDSISGAAVTFGDLKFGARISNNEFFMGEIDEYAYWTTALSDENIEWLSQNSLGAVIPEPSTLLLAVFGLLGVLGLGRRRRK